jgi:membrane-associated phospholipid phosphatase
MDVIDTNKFYKRDNYLWSIIRATPFAGFYYTLINCIIYTNFNNVYFFIVYCIAQFINYICKYLFRFIYNYFNINNIFLLGTGNRPNNCTNCGLFLRINNNSKPKSYGMPSGHSQLAWFFSIYSILTILEYNGIDIFNTNTYNINVIYFFQNISIKILFFIILAIIVSYSRIYVDKCHTLNQVIVGGIIGILLALIMFYLKNIIFEQYKKKYT